MENNINHKENCKSYDCEQFISIDDNSNNSTINFNQQTYEQGFYDGYKAALEEALKRLRGI